MYRRCTVSLLLLLSCLALSSAMAVNIVITGANRGLGLEMVKQIHARPTPSMIFALCRKTTEQLSSLVSSCSTNDKSSIVVVEDIDVSQDDCVPRLQSTFRTNEESSIIPIDLLIHNAGGFGPPGNFQTPMEMFGSQTLDKISMDCMRYAFELNTLGPLRVTQALLPNLRAGNSSTPSNKKIIIITSLMGSMTDNTSGKNYGYRTAKAAVNMVGKTLAEDLRNEEIAVGLVHPGAVFTGFGGNEKPLPYQREVEPSVQGVLEAIDSISMDNTGSFLHGNYGDGVKPLQW